MIKNFFGLNEQSAVKLLNAFSNEFGIHKLSYGLHAFIESPRKSGEGVKILIDCWAISKEIHEKVMNYFRKLNYRCEYIHREWGTYIMVTEIAR